MFDLEPHLIELGVASPGKLDEAETRRALYGGDLLTNLVELGTFEEALALLALSKAYQLPSALPGELPRASREVLDLVPVEMAVADEFYPVEIVGGRLRICVASPLAQAVRETLEQEFRLELNQTLTLRLRIFEALARDYGWSVDHRTLRALALLHGESGFSPGAERGSWFSGGLSAVPKPPMWLTERTRLTIPVAFSAEVMLPSMRTGEVPTPSSIDYVPGIPSIEPQPSTPVMASPAMDGAAESVHQALTRRPTEVIGESYPLVEAQAELSNAQSGGEALRLLVDFAARYFEYVALLLVQGGIATGYDARGKGPGRDRIRTVSVPAREPSTLGRAIATNSFLVAKLSDAGLDARLRDGLERGRGQQALILPVTVGERPIAVLYADNGPRSLELGKAGDVIAFGARLQTKLEELIRRRKMGTSTPPGLGF